MRKIYRFKILVGCGGDGHGKSESFILESRTEPHDLRKQIGDKEIELGVSLEDYCADYQDSSITVEAIESLGLKLTDFIEDPDDTIEDVIYLDADEYAYLYVLFLQKHFPEAKIAFVEENIPSFRIGGYGCFE